jgi:hypothetical protein
MADAGMVLASRYQLDRPFKADGAVEAWHASDLTTGRQVAVRLLRTTGTGPPGVDAPPGLDYCEDFSGQEEFPPLQWEKAFATGKVFTTAICA